MRSRRRSKGGPQGAPGRQGRQGRSDRRRLWQRRSASGLGMQHRSYGCCGPSTNVHCPHVLCAVRTLAGVSGALGSGLQFSQREQDVCRGRQHAYCALKSSRQTAEGGRNGGAAAEGGSRQPGLVLQPPDTTCACRASGGQVLASLAAPAVQARCQQSAPGHGKVARSLEEVAAQAVSSWRCAAFQRWDHSGREPTGFRG